MIFTHCSIFDSNFTTAIILRQKDSYIRSGFYCAKGKLSGSSPLLELAGLFFVSYWLTHWWFEGRWSKLPFGSQA
jgi:hypothetical protein